MKIKDIIHRLRNINGRRLAKATGIVLATALIITTICVLGRYAPAVLLTIVVALAIAAAYFTIEMFEE